MFAGGYFAVFHKSEAQQYFSRPGHTCQSRSTSVRRLGSDKHSAIYGADYTRFEAIE